MANEHEPIQATKKQKNYNLTQNFSICFSFLLFYLLLLLLLMVLVCACVRVCFGVGVRVSGSKSVLRNVVRLERYTFGSFQ